MSTSPLPPAHACDPQNDPFAAFESLNHAERQKFLSEFSTRFHPSDWWHLNQLFIARKGYKDILPNLPTELAIQVLENLEPLEMARFRRVSKHWNEILSSEAVCRSMAMRWYPVDAKTKSPARSWHRTLETSIAKERRILTGDAVNPLTIHHLVPYGEHDDDFWNGPTGIRSRSLFGSFLGRRGAFIDSRDKRTFSVLDLDTGKYLVRGLGAPARGVLSAVYMMQDYVMVTTEGDSSKAYVWNIRERVIKTIRLPTTRIQEFTADGNLFVAVLETQEDQPILYDAVANKTISMHVKYDPSMVHILYEEKNQYIVIRPLQGFDIGREFARILGWTVEIFCTRNGELVETRDVFTNPVYTSIDPYKCQKKFVRRNTRYGEHLFIVFMQMADDVDEMLLPGEIINEELPFVRMSTLIYNRQTGEFHHQRLHLGNTGIPPSYLQMFEDGTIYVTPHLQSQRGVAEIRVSNHVPMDSGNNGKFTVVNLRNINCKLPRIPLSRPILSQISTLHYISEGVLVFVVHFCSRHCMTVLHDYRKSVLEVVAG